MGEASQLRWIELYRVVIEPTNHRIGCQNWLLALLLDMPELFLIVPQPPSCNMCNCGAHGTPWRHAPLPVLARSVVPSVQIGPLHSPRDCTASWDVAFGVVLDWR